MPPLLDPQDNIPLDVLQRGQQALVRDAAWASLAGALSGGVVVVALALELGAGPMTIGVLGAIPFLAQAAQLPAIALVQRMRRRKLMGVTTLFVARLLIVLLALLPWVPAAQWRLPLLIMGQALIAILGSMAACAINSWFHGLLPTQGLGAFFSRRLLWGTGMASAGTLAAGMLVQQAGADDRLVAFAVTFFAAGCAGQVSTWYLTRCPEPRMPPRAESESILRQLRTPFKDSNFRRLLVMLGAWNLASNLVAPFMAVYLMRQLGYGLGTVTALWVISQAANACTLLAWGRVSDRLSHTAVLSVALPLYFACTLGFVFAPPHREEGQMVLLVLLHLLMGAAGGGIGLATGNLGLKLAPRHHGTAYLAAIGLVAAATGGVAPLLGGVLAQWFSERQLSLVVRWVSPMRTGEVSVLQFAHWEFLFAISAFLGLYAMHATARIHEDTAAPASERRVIQELALETMRAVNHLSGIGGSLGSVFTFSRLADLRRAIRKAEPP